VIENHPRLRAALSAALFVAIAAILLPSCRPQRSADGPPPPRGKTMGEYLQVDAGAPPVPDERPAADAVLSSMTVHFIDIGQGAATLIEFPCGAVLIDTGGEKNEDFDSEKALRDYLDAFFRRRADLNRTIDLLAISHPHVDHTRNIEMVIGRYKVLNVIDNGGKGKDIGVNPQNAMHAWVAAQKGAVGHLDVFADDIKPPRGATGPVIDPVGACAASDIDPQIHALWGGSREPPEKGENANDHSVVLRVDFGEASALFPGDLERLGIARITRKFRDHPEVFNVDLYQVAHHGSKNSTAEYFLELVRPEIAVISMGPHYRDRAWTARRFGHPHRIAIDQLIADDHGVRGQRTAPIEAFIGLRGAWKKTPSEFEKRTITKAIYATGWDGSVRVTAYSDGRTEVHTGL
jgi:competence protein ComEC